ncbi:MAG: hypothetical protein KC422_13330 [Trueperaceae bacterium]|nr:hypothetical protein [Trueperaceae bacterium]
MWFKPWHQVRPAYQALANGKSDEAFAWLERAFGRRQKAKFQLQLAAVYALFDERGRLRGEAALSRAAIFNRSSLSEPLYQVLEAEFAVIAGQSDQELKQTLRGLLQSEEGLVKFHASRALFKMGSYRLASRALLELESTVLPGPLQGRRLQMLAQSYVARGKEKEAAETFELALNYLKKQERMMAEFSLAESYLRLSRPDKAILILTKSDTPEKDNLQFVRKRYLEGVSHRHVGNFEEAFRKMQEAYNAIADQNSIPFEILLEMSRLCVDVGHIDNAITTYQQAFSVVSPEQYSMLMHEYGSLLKTLEDYPKAKDALTAVVKDVRYPKRIAACAELAMVEYKLGQLDAAEALAKYALDNGETTQACLCLGNIALEYFRFSEAETYFEKALAESSEGDSRWLTAQLMLAQTFAQEQAREPERLIFHAEQALKYLHPSDEWVATLRGYISSARESLDNEVRNLN